MFEGEKDTSQKILDAAFKCISEKGYANVSMRDIAEEANVVLSQINYYYKNKEGLFCKLIREVTQEYLRIIQNNLEGITTTKEKVSFFIEYCQDIMKENINTYRLILDLFSMSMWSKTFNQELNYFFYKVSKVIEEHITNDYLIDESLQAYSANTIARMILGTIFGTAMQYIIEPDSEEVLDGLNVIKVLIK